MRTPVFTGINQICIVVPDLEAAMKTYVEGYGIGPWEIFELNPSNMNDMVRNDEPSSYAMRLGCAKVGDMELELVQPLDEESTYAEFLAKHGVGVHHINILFDDFDETMDELRRKGHSIVMGGGYEGNTFNYMSTDRDLGVLTEVVDLAPGVEHPPAAVYPAA
jgi:catechol 2,3-dioxygenase-like lactoylglutathione lyase family enzyme